MGSRKVVVTGGAGFIGSNLAEELVNRGDDVTVVDNLATGRIENLGGLVGNKHFNFVEGSITDLDFLKGVFKGVSIVYHQAALPSVPRSIRDPIASNEANVNGTLNVLVAARDSGVKKVVYASSSSVYGETPTLPKSEDMCVSPLSPYAVSKMTGEFYCSVFERIYGLQTVSLRYFNVFGPRQDPSSQYSAVIPKFVGALLRDESPRIFGDGEQSRDFTFVKHVVDANILAAESKVTGVFNVACGRRITVNELVSILNEIVGKKIKPLYSDPRVGDVLHSLADISRAKSFGYDPDSNFKEELEETVMWFRNGQS